ncbi:MAG: hypothetical protein HOC20_04955 [Chloroflexi bacterium]|jgi:hypothetical protein|nr:hypothetical protein [Chloroflexota bacterium]
MRSEKEIKELRDEIVEITDFIVDSGTEEESEDEDVDFAHDVLDVLDWVLGGISTGDFKVEPYLNIAAMKEIVEDIKARTEEETEAE